MSPILIDVCSPAVLSPNHGGCDQMEDHVQDDGQVFGETEHAVDVGLAKSIVSMIKVSD